MSKPLKKIGFDRTVELPWMKMTAELAALKFNPQEINKKLDDMLSDKIKGKESRRKTRTVLLSVWVKTKKELHPLRSEAFELLRSLHSKYHFAVHWGMSMTTQPFFGDVATIIGRLVNLQGSVSEAEVQRRVKEIYGERQTVPRAVQRLLRTFMNWGALNKPRPGIYETTSPIYIANKKLITWIMQAPLYNSDSSQTINGILKNPVFFPFHFKNITSADLRKCSRLDIVAQALDEELVMLRTYPKNNFGRKF